MSTLRSKFAPIVVCLSFGLGACGDDNAKSTDDVTTPTESDDGYDRGPDTTSAESADTTADTTAATDKLVLKREGNILVDGDGMTLYIFTSDPPDTSTCNAGCVDTWPPLLVDDAGFTLQGDVVPTDFGVAVRDDGTEQVSYQGQPLYYYAGDSAPGDTNGDGIGGVWFMVEFS